MAAPAPNGQQVPVASRGRHAAESGPEGSGSVQSPSALTWDLSNRSGPGGPRFCSVYCMETNTYYILLSGNTTF